MIIQIGSMDIEDADSQEVPMKQEYETYSLSQIFKRDLLAVLERMVYRYSRYVRATRSNNHAKIVKRRQYLFDAICDLFSLAYGSIKNIKKNQGGFDELMLIERDIKENKVPDDLIIKSYYFGLIEFMHRLGITRIEYKKTNWEQVYSKGKV